MSLQQAAVEQWSNPGSLAAWAIDASWAAMAVRDARYGRRKSDGPVLASFQRCYQQLSWLSSQPVDDVLEIASAEVVVRHPYDAAQQMAVTMSHPMSVADGFSMTPHRGQRTHEWLTELGSSLESVQLSSDGNTITISDEDGANQFAQFLDSLAFELSTRMLELRRRTEATDYAVS